MKKERSSPIHVFCINVGCWRRWRCESCRRCAMHCDCDWNYYP